MSVNSFKCFTLWKFTKKKNGDGEKSNKKIGLTIKNGESIAAFCPILGLVFFLGECGFDMINAYVAIAQKRIASLM